jgi:hypothetical protein
MGCGAALAIRTLYPVAYERYRVYGHKTGNGHLQLGMVQLVQVTPHLRVANLMAQFGISRLKRMTDYAALTRCLASLAVKCVELGVPSSDVYFPHRMGSANAGGDWSIIEPLLLDFFPDSRLFTR